MTELSRQRGTTEVSISIRAPREAIYRACLDPHALATWRVPDNMTAQVHTFEAREGGRFRMTLTYNPSHQSPDGKTSEGKDTFEGRFAELIPGERIVEVIEFASADPTYRGEMTMTTTFTDTDRATKVTVRCEGLPPGIRLEDNRAGTEQALRKLAALATLNAAGGGETSA